MSGSGVVFEHAQTYTVRMDDDFVEYCQDDALSIEVR